MIETCYGAPDLAPDDAETLRRAIAATGAVQAVEAMIAQRCGAALRVLADLPIAAHARQELRRLTRVVSVR